MGGCTTVLAQSLGRNIQLTTRKIHSWNRPTSEARTYDGHTIFMYVLVGTRDRRGRSDYSRAHKNRTSREIEGCFSASVPFYCCCYHATAAMKNQSANRTEQICLRRNSYKKCDLNLAALLLVCVGGILLHSLRFGAA